MTLATHIIRDLGYAGVGLLTLCSGVIGVPGSEPTMLFAGFNVYDHQLTLVGVIVAGVIGDALGATVAYCIGYFGSQELVDKHGAKLHLSKSGVDRANRWFDRWGAPVIFVSRFLPFIRAAFPYVAGVSRTSYPRFLALVTAGSIVWIAALALLGRGVGSQWQTWRHHLEYVDYVGVAIVAAAVVYLIVRYVKHVRSDRERSGERAVDVV